MPAFHFRLTAARNSARFSDFLDTPNPPLFRGMYHRFDKLFFKHSCTIAQPLNGTFSSLTTKLSKRSLRPQPKKKGVAPLDKVMGVLRTTLYFWGQRHETFYTT
ncbi:MAG: hypothetical protein ACR2FY_01700, partial [Pirellulaceae bacterium]